MKSVHWFRLVVMAISLWPLFCLGQGFPGPRSPYANGYKAGLYLNSGGGGQSFPSLGGAWSDANQPASITQDSSNRLVFTNRMGWRSNGKFADASTVIATDWEGGLRGSLQNNGNTIRWANGTVWYRSGGGGQSFPSLGGAWSDANQPASITQDSNNRLVFTNRMGWRSNGKFADASTVIATDWEGGLRGSLQNNGNTIRWANGTVWYRSGGGGQSFPSLGGAWSDANQPASITQDSNNRLVFTNRMGWRSNGKFADASTVIATDWEGGLRGSLQNNGNTIRWANGTVWYRSGVGGQSFPSLGGAWSDDNQPASITQDSSNRLVFTNRMGWRSNGKFADASTVIATDWEGGLRGSLQNNGNTIRWANGTVWYRKR